MSWSPERVAQLREMRTKGYSVTLIADTLGLTKGQVIGKLRRQGIELGAPLIARASSRVYHRNDARGSIAIPLREVYRWGATLDLPLNQRGNIEAINRALRRENPKHPGFALANTQPTRLTWAV